MDPDEMRSFANTLLEVDSAGTSATARHRRERANGIVKLWMPCPTSPLIAGIQPTACNVVTEYLDHVVPVRGGRTACDASKARVADVAGASGRGSPKAQGAPLAADAVSAPTGPGGTCIREIGRAPFFFPRARAVD